MRVTTDKNDALNFKPDVGDLESSDDEQENDEGGLYKAPRIAAAHYYERGMPSKRVKYAALYRSQFKMFVIVTREYVFTEKGSPLVLLMRRVIAATWLNNCTTQLHDHGRHN